MATSPIEAMRIRPGTDHPLRGRDAGETFGWEKDDAKDELDDVQGELDDLQRRLSAQGTQSLLLLLQGMDAAGKDSTIRAVFSGINPAGVKVSGFKVPVGAEARHDYLWRCHAATPATGEIAVWNRSHYEDVLVVRVHSLVPEARWMKRYRHIREFEQMLADEGTRIVKIYLDISNDEQRERLQNRVDDPTDRWKFNPGDLDERSHWRAYRAAYDDALRETSTDDAPWYAVPADHKWVRNLAVAKILRQTLTAMKPRYPEAAEGVVGTVVK